MPRRVPVDSPQIGVNERMAVRFDDGSNVIIYRDLNGYTCKGRPEFVTATKQDLDEKLSFIAEDRGGLDKFYAISS